MIGVIFRLLLTAVGFGILLFIGIWFFMLIALVVLAFVLSQFGGLRLAVTSNGRKIGYIQNFKFVKESQNG